MQTKTNYNIRPLGSRLGAVPRSKHGISLLMLNLFSSLFSERVIRAILRSKHQESGKSHIQGMFVDSLEKAPNGERGLISRLMPSFSAAKKDQKEVPSPYQPGADWEKILTAEWGKFISDINHEEINELSLFLRNFFRNEGLSGYWGNSNMFDVFSSLDSNESRYRAALMNQQYEVWREAHSGTPMAELDAPRIGNPWGYVIDDALVYEPVFEYHHQASYLASLYPDTPTPVILEIGGGFGGLAFHILKKIPKAKYIGFDLPESMVLQAYYLSCAFPEARILFYKEGHGAIDRELLEQYDVILMPNFMLPQTESSIADIVVNFRSLSEMPMETINEYCSNMDRLSHGFIVHENIYKPRLDDWHGIPAPEFPSFNSHSLIAEHESIWPRYDGGSYYPCKSYLYIHKVHLTKPD